MATRDLVTQNLLQLSELFLASTSDPQLLEELEDELRYRRDPMALQLLLKVRGRLGSRVDAAAPCRTEPSIR